MGEQKRREAAEKLGVVVEELTKELTDKGMIIEAGWLSFYKHCMHPDSPPDQIRSMKFAFFSGAQHLYGSIMTMLDPDEEITEADERRMKAINDELNHFAEVLQFALTRPKGSA